MFEENKTVLFWLLGLLKKCADVHIYPDELLCWKGSKIRTAGESACIAAKQTMDWDDSSCKTLLFIFIHYYIVFVYDISIISQGTLQGSWWKNQAYFGGWYRWESTIW